MTSNWVALAPDYGPYICPNCERRVEGEPRSHRCEVYISLAPPGSEKVVTR